MSQAWNAARTMTPVLERLPDHNKDVLVYDGNDYMRAYHDGDDWWVYNVRRHSPIMYWMELPEVPE